MRVIIALSITILVVMFGDSVSTLPSVTRLQASLITLGVPGSRVDDSGAVVTLSGAGCVIESAFRAAFALTALGAIWAVFVFRGWPLAMLVLPVCGLLIGATSQILERIVFLSRHPTSSQPNYFLLASEFLSWIAVGLGFLFSRKAPPLVQKTI